MQKEILNALHSGERGMASSLLSRIGSDNHTFSAYHFVRILEHCASTPDPLFVMEIWNIMEQKGIGMNNKCHFLMIQALCKGGYVEEAFNLMSRCKETPGLEPTLPKYNCLLGASIHMQSATHVNKCLDLMEDDVTGKDEITYILLLKFAVLQQNLSAVHGIWKEYTRYYSHNLFSLGKFVWAFTKLGDLRAGFEALEKQLDLVVNGWFSIERNTEEKLTIPKLDIPIPFETNLDWSSCRQVNPTVDHCTAVGFDLEKVNIVRKVLHERKLFPVMEILRRSFDNVMIASSYASNCKLAELLFLQMQNLGLDPSSIAIHALIKVLVTERGIHKGIEMLNLLKQKTLKPHDATLALISVGCSKSLELDLAEAYLDQMSERLHTYPYNELLHACDIVDQPERAVRVFRKMKQLKIVPNFRTYELLFSLFASVNAPYESGNILSQVDAVKRIQAIEHDMLTTGVDHSYLSMLALLQALGKEGMITELLHYLRVAEKQFNSYLGTSIYTTVLQSLVKAKQSHTAVEIFKSMLACGYRPYHVTYTIMLDCCCITGSVKSALGLTAMMIRNGYMPTKHIYTVLIKLVVMLGDFDEALFLMNQACSEGIPLDVLVFNRIVKEAFFKDRIDVIEFVMKRMHERNIAPDASTCNHVFSTYVNGGFLTTALEALCVMSVHMVSEHEPNIDEKKSAFEDEFIYAEDSEAESRVLDLFKHKESLATGLLNLRWCAILGHPISWSTSQSHWVQRLSTGRSHWVRRLSARHHR